MGAAASTTIAAEEFCDDDCCSGPTNSQRRRSETSTLTVFAAFLRLNVGIEKPLMDPVLEVHDSNGAVDRDEQ